MALAPAILYLVVLAGPSGAGQRPSLDLAEWAKLAGLRTSKERTYIERPALVAGRTLADVPLARRPKLLTALAAMRGKEAVPNLLLTSLDDVGPVGHPLAEAVLAYVWAGDGSVYVACEGEVPRSSGRAHVDTMRQALDAYGDLVRELDHRAAKQSQAGRAFHGSPPFGFRSESGQLVEDPLEQPTLQQIMRMSEEEHRSTWQIAEALNAEGIVAKRGSEWHPITVGRVIKKEQQRRAAGG